MRIITIVFLALALHLPLLAQDYSGEGHAKYWVYFRDKGASTWTPEQVLSDRALARRARHGVHVTAQDWPVDANYLQSVGSTGAILRHPSRWFNAVSAWMDEATLAQVQALPFVRAVEPIRPWLRDMDALPSTLARNGYDPGFTGPQLRMIGLDRLHKAGYNGRGVVVAVMDNGFRNANQNIALQHLFDQNQIMATRDFVNNEEDVYDQGDHGQMVLSILAGFHENASLQDGHYGSAHGATFILCHTENDASETTQEEDNWVAAMEWADSLGADVFSTSLAYRDFDGGFDYGYAGMDGNTAIITRGADLAAARGIVVLNSAGNSGVGKIAAPADGDSVIAVGAVDSLERIAGFSSHGPSFDQRVKPDFCAMGVQTAYVRPSDQFMRGNGTSFSCPVLSGMVACLLQASPSTTNMALYDALRQSADHRDNPDSLFGYGIPDGVATYRLLNGTDLPPAVAEGAWPGPEVQMLAYPSPFTDALHVAIDHEGAAFDAVLTLVDNKGAAIWKKGITVHPFYNLYTFDPEAEGLKLSPGTYTLAYTQAGMRKATASTKVIYHKNP